MELNALKEMVYPGRGFILGTTSSEESRFAIYILTGRSPSSKARILVQDSDGSIRTQPTDPEVLKTGNPALLIYRAISPGENHIVVSNGHQTDHVADLARTKYAGNMQYIATDILKDAMKDPVYQRDSKGELVLDKEGKPIDLTSFEPDKPIYTPRIVGIASLLNHGSHISRNDGTGHPKKKGWGFDYIPGIGKLLPTYKGDNMEPLQSFRDMPLSVVMPPFDRAKDLADAVWEALNPNFRVSVAAVLMNVAQPDKKDYHIINA